MNGLLAVETHTDALPRPRTSSKPKLGFLGAGWIGRNRLEAIARSELGEIAAIADPVRDMATRCRNVAPETVFLSSLDELLELPLDGIVIATPSALHAEQAIAALERGIAVFCQKPLGRNQLEVARVIAAARRANVLLGVDLSYRSVRAIRRVRELIDRKELGRVFAADLVFHNAYGPDKPWFYDRKLSGGGCVMDLGIHLVDLGLWLLDYPRIDRVSSRLFAQGKPINGGAEVVEDYAVARLDLDGGATALVSCSWKLNAGCDAVISGTFYGTEGGARFHNVDGSFYHFAAERFRGTTREQIASPDDDWGGQAAVQWAAQVAAGAHYDPEIEKLIDVTGALDAIYAV
jgi:predicted dehydrogenase